MFKKFFIIIYLLGLSTLYTQSYFPVRKSIPQNEISFRNLQDINILAVMVEFQPDDFDLTYGDGTFGSIYSKDYGNDIIDPLPHNKNYFEDHLKFVENYYSKVSGSRVNISYTVLPDIMTVSKPMREYSPVEGEGFKLLGDFSNEVWNLVDDSYSDLDYSTFNTFVIFHAGAGKDISTSDLFGEARDLPSIYLGFNSLKEFYGDSFNGFEVGNGFNITSTIILPETESREEAGIGGTSLIELSINGLIVSSIASHMGLPDLFDAETGKSAIGRFGLMDGQSLFAFAGLFPPEPSAWEKIFLGWEEPLLINETTANISVTARQVASETDAKIIKIPINSTEYYLVENRSRDANNDGITVTYKVGGEIRTINFSEDLDSFNNAFVDTLKGVVLDVDEFDWAVPGNGILIWHIDEKIIQAQISKNRINVGDSRGVDLEEADGIQDIGEEFQTIFGDIIIAEGDEFDFWYSGNTSKLYSNQFGAATKPNTNTNYGANSLIDLKNFSSIGNVMNFDVEIGSATIKLEDNYNIDPNLNVSNYKVISHENTIGAYFRNGSTLYRTGNGMHRLNDFSNNDYVVLNDENNEFVIGGLDNSLNIAVLSDNTFTSSSFEVSSNITSPIVVNKLSESEIEIYLGLASGTVEKYYYNLQTQASPSLEETTNLFSDEVSQIILSDEGIISSSRDNLNYKGETKIFNSDIIKIAASKSKNGHLFVVVLTENNQFHRVQDGEIHASIENYDISNSQASEDFVIESFSLADLKNDGENYIVFSVGNEIHAINGSGSSAENFPVQLISSENLMDIPLIADVNNDGYSDVVASLTNGNIFAVSGKDGKILNNYTLSTGGDFSGNYSITKKGKNLLLSSVSSQNDFYFWNISSEGDIDWGSEYSNNSNNALLKAAGDQNYISAYFPKDRTYNWPNPVYEDQTFIRTYVNEDSDVMVKIFDLSGDLVDEFKFSASGGLDSEYPWNVTDIQSGAYFAHVEVKSNSGKTESKIIKIAVIK